MTPMRGQLTMKALHEMKGKQMIMMTTANEDWDANAAQEAGFHILRIGGFLDDDRSMLERLEKVKAGAPKMIVDVVTPLYQANISNEEAIRLSALAYRHGADSIYLQVDPERVEAVAKTGIPVSAHIGLNPLYSTWVGGIRGYGKTCEEALEIYRLGRSYQDAGACFITVEISNPKVTHEIAKRLSVPVISLGSGSDCDGTYLFSSDILGNQLMPTPRHAKQYRNFHQEAIEAFKEFKEESENHVFPPVEKTVKIPDEEFERFMDALEKE